MNGAVYTPVSLGNTCEAKFQIARILYTRRYPEGSQLAFRLQMVPPHRGRDIYRWDIFDWQGTSFWAVRQYLERDFKGVFERADLDVSHSSVIQRELGTQHIHDFEVLVDYPREPVTPEVVDRGFQDAKAHFEEMAEAFRKQLTCPGPFLYIHVCEDIPPDWEVWRMINHLTARSPEHRFHLLLIGLQGEADADLSALDGWVSKAVRPRTWDKPKERYWEGDNAAWDAALAPFDLAFPDGTLAAPPPEPISRSSSEPVQAVKKPATWRRLLASLYGRRR